MKLYIPIMTLPHSKEIFHLKNQQQTVICTVHKQVNNIYDAEMRCVSTAQNAAAARAPPKPQRFTAFSQTL